MVNFRFKLGQNGNSPLDLGLVLHEDFGGVSFGRESCASAVLFLSFCSPLSMIAATLRRGGPETDEKLVRLFQFNPRCLHFNETGHMLEKPFTREL